MGTARAKNDHHWQNAGKLPHVTSRLRKNLSIATSPRALAHPLFLTEGWNGRGAQWRADSPRNRQQRGWERPAHVGLGAGDRRAHMGRRRRHYAGGCSLDDRMWTGVLAPQQAHWSQYATSLRGICKLERGAPPICEPRRSVLSSYHRHRRAERRLDSGRMRGLGHASHHSLERRFRTRALRAIRNPGAAAASVAPGFRVLASRAPE